MVITSLTSGEEFQIRNVTPEYIQAFRIKTPEGKPVADGDSPGIHNALVLAKEMADVFLSWPGWAVGGGGEEKVRHSKLVILLRTPPVSTSIRTERNKSAVALFFPEPEGNCLTRLSISLEARNAEHCVRMKENYTRDGQFLMNRFSE